jgi:hypothetical protein
MGISSLSAKRKSLWKLRCQMVESNKTAIMTSLAMEGTKGTERSPLGLSHSPGRKTELKTTNWLLPLLPIFVESSLSSEWYFKLLKHLQLVFNKRKEGVRRQWITPITHATQEAEIRRIMIQSQPRQMVCKTLP